MARRINGIEVSRKKVVGTGLCVKRMVDTSDNIQYLLLRGRQVLGEIIYWRRSFTWSVAEGVSAEFRYMPGHGKAATEQRAFSDLIRARIKFEKKFPQFAG